MLFIVTHPGPTLVAALLSLLSLLGLLGLLGCDPSPRARTINGGLGPTLPNWPGDETSGGDETSSGDETSGEPLLDLGDPGTGGDLPDCGAGCSMVDIVLVVAGDTSSQHSAVVIGFEETLHADLLAALATMGSGCEGMDYRIGITDGWGRGWIEPGSPTCTDLAGPLCAGGEWAGSTPWFDSMVPIGEVSLHESSAMFVTFGVRQARLTMDLHPIACDHPLASVVDLLAADAALEIEQRFRRPGALLVVAIVTNGDEPTDLLAGLPGTLGAAGCAAGCEPARSFGELSSAVFESGGVWLVVAGDPANMIGGSECGAAMACGRPDQTIETFDPESGTSIIAQNVKFAAPTLRQLADASPGTVTMIDACADDGAGQAAARFVDAFGRGGIVANACAALGE